MSQRLRALTAVAEDWGLGPSTHIHGAHNLNNSSSKGVRCPLLISVVSEIHMVHTHTCMHNIHTHTTNKINNSLNSCVPRQLAAG